MKTPLGWKREILDNVSVIQTGLAKGKAVNTSPARLPYLRVANVQDGFLDLTEIKEIEVEQSQIERYRIFPGDILLTEGGDRDKLGRGTLWEGQIPLCLHQNHIFVVRANKNIIFNKFLAYLFSSPLGKKYFLSCAKQSTNLASINSTQLRNFPLVFPSIQEQKAIAAILSTWDEAIEKMERLIVLKEKKTKYLRSKFYRDLKSDKIPLSEVAYVGTGQAAPQNAEEFSIKGSPFLRVSSLDKLMNGNENDIEFLNDEFAKKNKMKLFPAKTLIFAKSGMSIRLNRLHILEQPSYLVSHLAGIIPSKNLDIHYLKFLFEITPPSKMLQGDGFPSIRTSEIESILIKYPSLNKQKEIGEKFKYLQYELYLLFEYLKLLRNQKNGLMQKLLTGKWRVNFKEEK